MRTKIFTTVLFVDIIIFLIFVYLILGAQSVLLDIRHSLFAEITENSEVFEITKTKAAQKYSFLIENQNAIRDYSQKIKQNVNYITPETIDKLQAKDVAHKAQFIALLYSKNGGPAGCGDFSGLMNTMLEIDDNDGMGCCSDHSEVFIALSHVLGLNSREVSHTHHTFNEIYDPDVNKWLWIDTQYALMAKDDEGNYLSLLEMMKRMSEGRQIRYDFFGNSSHVFSRSLPNEHRHYDSKDDFEYIMLNLGDNVFSQDHFNGKLKFLPKPIRQMISIVLGIQPKYIIYAAEMNEELNRLHSIKVISIVLFSTLIVGNVLAFLVMPINLIKKRLTHN